MVLIEVKWPESPEGTGFNFRFICKI